MNDIKPFECYFRLQENTSLNSKTVIKEFLEKLHQCFLLTEIASLGKNEERIYIGKHIAKIKEAIFSEEIRFGETFATNLSKYVIDVSEISTLFLHYPSLTLRSVNEKGFRALLKIIDED